MRARLVLAVVLIAVLGLGGAVADTAEREERERELEELRERIDAVRERLAADREERDEISVEIERIEREIAELAGRVDDLDQRIDEHRARIAELGQRQEAAREQLEGHRETLEGQLRAAYRLGREPALRLLLRQDEPDAVSRAMGYYGYINNARLAAIGEVADLVAELGEIRTRTESARADLARDRESLDREQERLAAARVEREEILAALERDIAERGQRLETLQEDREQLESLLNDLGEVMADIPDDPREAGPFAERSGELDWPVDGDVRTDFGSPRAGGRMQWRGLVIAAEHGTRVHAIYHGRVVFADWLSGFGQLVIVDHRDGFMSLYGFNERLLRAEGEWVMPGDPIAIVGNSGAQDEPGVYFEIRRDGEPRNPRTWLASR